MPNKILIVSQELPPKVGGAGVVAWQNAKMLANAGHNVTLLGVSCGYINSNEEQFKLIRIFRFGKLWIFNLALHLYCLPLREFDHIIINDIGAAMVFSLFFQKSPIINKTFVYLHGGEIRSILKESKREYKVIGFRERFVNILRRCRKIIAVSFYMKEYFLQHFFNLVDSNKVEVIYAGVDRDLFFPRDINLHAELDIPDNKTILVSVSRITEEKGYAKMMEVYKQIINIDQSFYWLIIGDGPYLKTIQEWILSNDLSGCITCLGTVKRSDLSHYYCGADLFWLFTDTAESFGLVYAEAQACGIPVLGPRNYGVVEAVADGCSGFLIKEIHESIEIILAKKYVDMDKATINSFASKFYLEKQLEKLEALLNE